LLRSEIPSGMCAKLHTVATSNNRHHAPRSLYYCFLLVRATFIWRLFFAPIPLVVNHTFNVTPQRRGCNTFIHFYARISPGEDRVGNSPTMASNPSRSRATSKSLDGSKPNKDGAKLSLRCTNAT